MPFLYSGNECIIDGVILTGTQATVNVLDIRGEGQVISNIVNTSTNYAGIKLSSSRSTVNNISTKTGITLTSYGYKGATSNINVNAGSIDLQPTSSGTYNNIYTTSIDLTDTSCSNNTISNLIVAGTSTVSINGDKNTFTNCVFNGAVTVSNGTDNADDNGFVNCIFTDSTSALTVGITANRTRIIGCTTNVAITDNGTDTATSANTVY